MKKSVLLILLLLVACASQQPMARPVSTGPELMPVVEVPIVEETEVQSSAQTFSVVIENFAFSPAEINVKVGDTVVWTQRDDVKHTATSVDGPESFDSGLLAKGQSFSYTFTKAGTYNYICTPHPRMKGKVVVE